MSAMKFGRYDFAAFVTFFAYACGAVVLPVALVAVSDDLGFSLAEGGMEAGGALGLGRTVMTMSSMVLCGFLAGRWGKRRTLGIAVALMGVGVLVCSAAPIYAILFGSLMLAGAGDGIIEGLATPFVQDLHPDEPGRYINFTHSFWSIGVVVTVLATGGLMSLGVPWRVLVAGAAMVAFVAAVMLLWPEREDRKYPEHPEVIPWKTVAAQAGSILRRRRFWVFFVAMFLAGGGELCLTFWCASYVQLSFAGSAWAGGVGTACFAGGMFVGRTGWGFLIRQHQLKQLVVFSAVIGALITLTIPHLQNLWLLFVVLFFSGVATAPFWPSVQSYSSDRLPEANTTMLFILLSCAGIPGCGAFTWLMGYIGNINGDLREAFYLVPSCYLALAGLIGFDWLCSVRERSKGC